MVKIEYLAHSCFKITNGECDIIIDPYKQGYVPGTRKLEEKANLVLTSHDHLDHNAIDEVFLKKLDYEILEKTLKIIKIYTFHDTEQGKIRGENIIHVIEIAGYKIAHLGDLGCDLTKEEEKLLEHIDVLMIPVGGFYTINALEAKKIVENLRPKVVIPMHFKGKNFGFDNIDEVEVFTNLFETVENTNRSDYFIRNIQNENKIVVLKPKNIY